jgi:branched-chain amino acid aminotransferase
MAAHTTFLSLNGQLVPWDEARVHMLSPAFKYGACVFEGIRGYRAAAGDDVFIFRLKEHLDRLEFGMRVMRFDAPPSVAAMEAALIALIRANGSRGDMHIRLLVWVDGDGEQTATGPVGWGIGANPRPDNPRVKQGVHVGVSSWTRTADNAMPARLKVTANYNNGRLSGLQGKADGYDNVILLTAAGHVSESPSSCFFMVRDGVPVTPGLANDILESVTRATLMELLEDEFGLRTQERDIARTELYAAQEAFFCGSGGEIQPILSIDRLPVGKGEVGPVTRQLQEAYFAAVRGAAPGRSSWLTPVWASD